jgi:hypothetical protein
VFSGHLKSYFTNEAVSCKISECDMARLSGFVWRICGSVGVGGSAFELTGIYSSNRNRVPKYIYIFVSDTSRTITCMDNATLYMAVVGLPSTSVTNSQNVLLILAGPSLCTLSNKLPSKSPLKKLLPPDV